MSRKARFYVFVSTFIGTHDTMALYGWPVSQCQSLSTPLIVQLVSGIRVLDVRLSLIKDRLIAYHGIYPQRTPFASILSTLFTFLSSPQSSNETLVISIKQEDFMTTPWLKFSTAVLEEIKESEGGLDMWYLEDRIPTLGEVRGKCVLFSRFGGDGSGWDGGLNGMGIHPKTWPDSEKEGFEWDCNGVTVRTHDWYNIPSFLSIPEKTQLATEILLPPSSQSVSAQTLNIAFFSAASFPLAFPPTIARGFGFPKIGLGVEGVNARVGKWLLDILSSTSFKSRGEKESEKLQYEMNEVGRRVRGWPLLDFFQDPEDNGVVPLLVECNFRGRVSGEEGWP
ncbi:PLC-like phosphodiesterase [Abortiporus biennis]|nr:PLC-like phosphodiesterase [Abortiporus biennis]